MNRTRRQLRRLNAARAVAVSTLLLVALATEIVFKPRESLGGIHLLSAFAFGTVLLYALLDRWMGETKLLAALQVAGDVLLVSFFVFETGGPLSPLSFLYAVPVMVAAAMLGLVGGLMAAGGAWFIYGSLLVHLAWYGPPGEVQLGGLLYGAVSHLVGFLTLGALGGLLADRLARADRELEERQVDLEALRALHADIVESISTGLMTTDPQGIVTFVNQAGRAILHERNESAIGGSAARLFGLPEDFLEQAEDHLQSGRRYRFERQWSRPADGEDLFLGFAVSKLAGPSGRADGWLIVFQDLTEIASLEEQVRTRERMAALGEMAAGIAHELRNPLAAVTGCVQVLQQRTQRLAGADGDDEGGDLLQIVVRESSRLDRTIRDFLMFARPGEFKTRLCDLAQLMEELARMLRKSPDFSSAHSVVVETGPRATQAPVDPDRIRQVFWNLASNALKAMPEGGKLTIHVGGFGGDQVLVAFRDEGCGMDQEAVKRYFQPFRGDFKTGSGLGAAIVYRIIEEHGGRVQVVSHPGRGTEIRLLLPGVREYAHA